MAYLSNPELTAEQREQIIKALQDRGATNSCPRCGNASFTVLNGYFTHSIQPNLGGLTLGGPSVPTAVVVCTRCGWLAEHALGTLGLLQASPQNPEGAPK
jgi:ribosomal protein S27AE